MGLIYILTLSLQLIKAICSAISFITGLLLLFLSQDVRNSIVCVDCIICQSDHRLYMPFCVVAVCDLCTSTK